MQGIDLAGRQDVLFEVDEELMWFFREILNVVVEIEFAALGVNGILHNLNQHQTIVKEFNIAEAPFKKMLNVDVCVI